MAGKSIRIYADTSVFGGVFDEEFEDASRIFFENVRIGRFELASSSLVRLELEPAPLEVRRLFDQLVHDAHIADITEDVLALRDAYLGAKIVGASYSGDALHVALATVSACSIIVSWNFKHIVHFRKIPLYNAINAIFGYAPLAIHSPLEVIQDENENF
jgi:predicted nucleic acid-binding protein